eukprot:scaffold18081_cov89-Isochrysis_galbana.AAC.7
MPPQRNRSASGGGGDRGGGPAPPVPAPGAGEVERRGAGGSGVGGRRASRRAQAGACARAPDYRRVAGARGGDGGGADAGGGAPFLCVDERAVSPSTVEAESLSRDAAGG